MKNFLMMAILACLTQTNAWAGLKIVAKFQIPDVKEGHRLSFTLFDDLSHQLEVYKADKRVATCRYTISHVTYQDRSVVEQAFFSLVERQCDVVGDYSVDEVGLLNKAVLQLRPKEKTPSQALFYGLYNTDTITVSSEKLDKKALKRAIEKFYSKLMPLLKKRKKQN